MRTKTILDHYERINCIQLEQTVPNEIGNHLENAKNLLLYSWYACGFIPVAEMYAIISLEYALKVKTEATIPGFRNMMEYAILKGWWKKENFSRWQHINSMNEMRKEEHEKFERVIGRKLPFTENRFDFMGRLPGYFEFRRNLRSIYF